MAGVVAKVESRKWRAERLGAMEGRVRNKGRVDTDREDTGTGTTPGVSDGPLVISDYRSLSNALHRRQRSAAKPRPEAVNSTSPHCTGAHGADARRGAEIKSIESA